MSRCPWLSASLLVPWLVGCAPSLHPGLANAPRLGGTGLADERIGDVVSNGGDSCGRYAERGPLQGRIPPCPSVSPARAALFEPAGVNDALVVPWLKHFYYGWPCPHATPSETRTEAWVSLARGPSACTLP